MLDKPGAYLHFPWCVRKCPYCDFNSHPDKPDTDFDAYTEALIVDWHNQKHRYEPKPFASVFLGGGTPSLFSPRQMERVISELQLEHSVEVTMEANPGTTEHAHCADNVEAGINRLSIGAQSFDDKALKALGRIHSADETHQAFAEARRGGFENINLDLMWGLPGQTPEDAMADLQTAISLGPEHISWYQLTIEPKTEFAKRTPLLPVEDDLYAIEQTGLEVLAAAGYRRYEVSAYAQKDKQSRHNLNYWEFGDYVGVGAGAHGKVTRSTDDIVRTQKASQPRIYQGAATNLTEAPVKQSAKFAEFMMNALRLLDGTTAELFTARTGHPWDPEDPVWTALAEDGLVDPQRPVATAMGLRFLDTVLSRLLEADD